MCELRSTNKSETVMQQYSIHDRQSIEGQFFIQKMSYKRRKLLTINGMVMSQLIRHSSCYSEKMLMQLGDEDYIQCKQPTCIIKSLLLPAVTIKRKVGSIFSQNFFPNFRENVHNFSSPFFQDAGCVNAPCGMDAPAY